MVVRESEESKIKTIKSKQRSLKELQGRFPVGKYLDNKVLKILQKKRSLKKSWFLAMQQTFLKEHYSS